MYEYNTYRLQDLRTGLQTILDQLETIPSVLTSR